LIFEHRNCCHEKAVSFKQGAGPFPNIAVLIVFYGPLSEYFHHWQREFDGLGQPPTGAIYCGDFSRLWISAAGARIRLD
jgi:hypothetical protein